MYNDDDIREARHIYSDAERDEHNRTCHIFIQAPSKEFVKRCPYCGVFVHHPKGGSKAEEANRSRAALNKAMTNLQKVQHKRR